MNDDPWWGNFTKNVKPLKIRERSNNYGTKTTEKISFQEEKELFFVKLSGNNKFAAKNDFNHLNKLTIKNFKKFQDNYSILDLHEKNIEDSLKLSEIFIKKNFLNNNRYLLIITGKGHLIEGNYSGKIKNEIHNWINFSEINQFILTYSGAPKHLGGEGALIILLKKLTKF